MWFNVDFKLKVKPKIMPMTLNNVVSTELIKHLIWEATHFSLVIFIWFPFLSKLLKTRANKQAMYYASLCISHGLNVAFSSCLSCRSMDWLLEVHVLIQYIPFYICMDEHILCVYQQALHIPRMLWERERPDTTRWTTHCDFANERQM